MVQSRTVLVNLSGKQMFKENLSFSLLEFGFWGTGGGSCKIYCPEFMCIINPSLGGHASREKNLKEWRDSCLNLRRHHCFLLLSMPQNDSSERKLFPGNFVTVYNVCIENWTVFKALNTFDCILKCDQRKKGEKIIWIMCSLIWLFSEFQNLHWTFCSGSI